MVGFDTIVGTKAWLPRASSVVACSMEQFLFRFCCRSILAVGVWPPGDIACPDALLSSPVPLQCHIQVKGLGAEFLLSDPLPCLSCVLLLGWGGAIPPAGLVPPLSVWSHLFYWLVLSSWNFWHHVRGSLLLKRSSFIKGNNIVLVIYCYITNSPQL